MSDVLAIAFFVGREGTRSTKIFMTLPDLHLGESLGPNSDSMWLRPLSQPLTSTTVSVQNKGEPPTRVPVGKENHETRVSFKKGKLNKSENKLISIIL